MKHEPLTRQRSPWVGVPAKSMDFGGGVVAHYFTRQVADGTLGVFLGHEPLGPENALRWHLSISYQDRHGANTRYPSWDEQVHALREVGPQGVTWAMILPPDGDGYVNLHPTTMHWHEMWPEDPA